jgi:peptidoglycan/LPS O-acetylase OafA/YrhL
VKSSVSVILRTSTGTDYATWLRGMAALGVLTIHYGGLGLRELFPQGSWFSKILNNLVDFGGQGPTIFFVASGYVLHKYSYDQLPIRNLFLTRYFRLAPAYILVLFLAALSNGSLEQLSLSMLVKKALFLDIFFSDAYAFNPIGIGYFVVVEFWLTTFLLLGPVMFSQTELRSQARAIGILVMSFFISYFSTNLASLLDIQTFHFDVLKYQFFFLLGMACTRWRMYSITKLPARLISIFSLVVALSIDQYLGYVAAVFAIAMLLSESESGSLVPFGKLPIFLGNICYSIYLSHIPIIVYFQLNFSEVSLVVVVFAVISISTALFMGIERPFIQLGKRVAYRL